VHKHCAGSCHSVYSSVLHCTAIALQTWQVWRLIYLLMITWGSALIIVIIIIIPSSHRLMLWRWR
jgi:hypothetical protein